MKTADNRTLGIYYELPCGKIAYTYGFSSVDKTISYHHQGEIGSTVSYNEFNKWIPRPDLKDWPDSKDPVLPYVFDLFYDIKRVSELKSLLEELTNDADHLKQLIAEHNIIL